MSPETAALFPQTCPFTPRAGQQVVLFLVELLPAEVGRDARSPRASHHTAPSSLTAAPRGRLPRRGCIRRQPPCLTHEGSGKTDREAGTFTTRTPRTARDPASQAGAPQFPSPRRPSPGEWDVLRLPEPAERAGPTCGAAGAAGHARAPERGLPPLPGLTPFLSLSCKIVGETFSNESKHS